MSSEDSRDNDEASAREQGATIAPQKPGIGLSHNRASAGTPSYLYQSAFDDWHSRAWVRRGTHRSDPFDDQLDFFSRDLSLLFRHSTVCNAPRKVQSGLLVHHLYNYLDFTVWLEMGPVNEVCEMIRRPGFLDWLPPAMKSDVMKIYTDEAGHAQMSHELAAAVEVQTGIKPLRGQKPVFLDTLDHLILSRWDGMADLVKLFFAIVSETLITGFLGKMPSEKTVQVAVRNVVADHAKDEALHYRYFRSLFEFIWPRLPRALRQEVGVMLPDMLLTFLSPDRPALTRMLEQYPDNFSNPASIVNEVAEDESTWADIQSAATTTIAMLRKAGVFDDELIREAFGASHLSFERAK